jgi:hypothetical protein
MNRLQLSLARQRAIRRVAKEEFDLRFSKHGLSWDQLPPDKEFRKTALISIATDTVERYERALEAEGVVLYGGR